VTLASLAVAASAHGGATAAPATARLCAAISGPRWTMHAGIATVAGGRYQIGVLNVTCAKATKYVKQFYVRHSPGLQKPLTGGPAGFRCRSATTKGRLVSAGTCKRIRKGSTTAAFAWSPKRG